jgi:hypothetical protein
MNQTLKETLSKLAIETGGDWVALLPYAIFWVRNSPYVHGLTPFEILYGALPPITVRTLPDQDPSMAPNYLASLKALQEVQREICAPCMRQRTHRTWNMASSQGIGYG